jgi:hypothetical protein
MDLQFTSHVNDQNVNYVREQIQGKKSFNPYYATAENVSKILTDYDTFPYPRWYRGVPNESRPVIAEREAGWRQQQPNCYKVMKPVEEREYEYPNHCFEGPCSTVYPCYPRYMQKFSDREALNVILNKACIAQYR